MSSHPPGRLGGGAGAGSEQGGGGAGRRAGRAGPRTGGERARGRRKEGAELGGGQGEPVTVRAGSGRGVWGWVGVSPSGERARESESALATVTAQHGWTDARGAVASTLGSAREGRGAGGRGTGRADGQGTREGCAQGKTEHTKRLTILRLPLKGGAERLGASQCSFYLCHPRRGGVPGGGCPTRPEAAPPREQVKKLDPEKTCPPREK
ncbi:glycine-rich cell wall structural protein 1.8-like [Mastomys coucha]|uniref:glycine-rich cell wall structural protein 1.8-like n=1 Tax=Mastomys coucha TaxID=35658 RepID=UPI001261891C|nr:glycine-rich cell wall structural protein 1.8-like [Mastomys coucha]